jgi:hypothetical protein
MPDRFTEFPDLREHKRLLWDEPECTCHVDGDQADARNCPLHAEDAACPVCSNRGGVPFLMMDDQLYCSRCFEHMNAEEFHEWLHDGELPIRSLKVENPEVERRELVAIAEEHIPDSASPLKKDPAKYVQRPASLDERKKEAA